MALHRSLAATALAAALAASLLITACADDHQADPVRVKDRGTGTTTTTGMSTSTTSPPDSTSPADPTTSTPSTPTEAPPSTKPLTTAPPSALLTEVTAAYDAAYADLLAATVAGDPDYPALGNQISGAQLEQWRSTIRGLRVSGTTVRVVDTGKPARRVEGLEKSSATKVEINVCRFPNEVAIDPAGREVASDDRPFRYLETLELTDGGWKWTGREWIDPSNGSSDCAQP